MAPKEGAVLLRSLGTNSRKFDLPKLEGRTFEGPRLREGKCLARKQESEIEFSRIFVERTPNGG